MAIGPINVIPPAPSSGRRKPAVNNNQQAGIYAFNQKEAVKNTAVNDYADTFTHSK